MTGHCACRACTIEVTGCPSLNAICHCANCRRRTGSAFGWSVYFPESQVDSISGNLQPYVVATQPGQTRWFCSNCGTTLYWRSGFWPDSIGVAGGCFEGQLAEPAGSYQHADKLAWLGLPESWHVSG